MKTVFLIGLILFIAVAIFLGDIMEKFLNFLLDAFIRQPFNFILTFLQSLPEWFIPCFCILLILLIVFATIARSKEKLFEYYFGEDYE